MMENDDGRMGNLGHPPPSDDSSGVLDVRSLSGVLDAKICICNPLHHDIPSRKYPAR